jgi:pimeloyl-ACP methyl ester carboxylesterase
VAADIHYAESNGAAIAYRVIGDGPLTILTAPGFVSHLEILPQLPEVAATIERLASLGRLILFDKREQGLSDRLGRAPTIEEMVDDMRAVMDATETERAALLGLSEGAAMALMFAATYPERSTHLAIWGVMRAAREHPAMTRGSPRRRSTHGPSGCGASGEARRASTSLRRAASAIRRSRAGGRTSFAAAPARAASRR